MQYHIVQLSQSRVLAYQCVTSLLSCCQHCIKHRLSSLTGYRDIGPTQRSHSVSLKALCFLVVMHSSNSPCSWSQDIRLTIPPDLTYDTFPLLQSLCPLQLLSWSEYVHTQCPIWLAGVITDRDFCAGQNHRCLYIFHIFVFVILALLLLLLTDVL